jgi:hypothetical protein
VTRFFGICIHKQTIFMITEFCPGGTLEDYVLKVRDGRLTE